MLKKGLFTLVCLTVMSAVCAWAATTYSVRTQLTNSGGSIKVGNKAAQTAGIAYTNCTTAVTVVVTPNAGFRITSLKQIDGATATDITPADGTVAATVDITKPTPVDPKRPAVLKAQGLTATFASTNDVVVPKTWQLQLTNTNRGGTITTNGAKGLTLSSVGLPKLVNYTDATPVTATVNATAGYKIRSITTTGAAAFSNNSTVAVVTGIPATGKSVNPVLVTYKLNAYAVATNAGIAPANPSVSHGGAVRLIVTPTGSNNRVTSLTVTGGSVALTDRFGTAVTLPFQGPVKATISNITSDITVTAAYGLDTTAAMENNCTNTCHLGQSVSQAVKDLPAKWLASDHKANGIDCVTCHTTMPGPIVKASVDANTFTVTEASAGTVGTNYCSRCHAASVTKVLASVHYTKPSGALECTSCHAAGHNPQFNAESCAGCHAVVNDHTVATIGSKTCMECHDKHNPSTVTGTLGPVTPHPAVTLYTFEEIGMQMAGGAMVPVQVDANGKGMPYSPKQTCGTAGCHVKNGIDYTYDKISDHAFHSNEGRSEYQDSTDGKFNATKNKPWTQSTAMVGKW